MLKKSRILLVLALTLTALYTGCAFGTRHVSLKPVYAQGFDQKVDENANPVRIPLPADHRPDKSSIGCVRNGFGMKTAKVVSDVQVPDWVQTLVAKNLAQCGFDIIDQQEAVADDSETFTVMIDLFELYCDSYMQYEAKVQLNTVVKQNDKIVSQGAFSGAAANMNWTASSQGYSDTIHAAMQDCINKLIPFLYTALAVETVSTNQ